MEDKERIERLEAHIEKIYAWIEMMEDGFCKLEDKLIKERKGEKDE